jgi:hypothetical protein
VTTPLPPFTVGAANYIEALADRKRKQTLEVIQAVRSDGWVRVVNTWVPVTGKVQLRAGQTVAVMWRDGIPQVAMMNQARRGGGDVTQAIAGAVVEELFIAGAVGAREVWFRNDQQVTNLSLRRRLDAEPVYVKWGTRADSFVVATAAHHYYICTLSRDEKTILGSSTAAATIVRDEQPLDQNIALVAAQNTFTLTGETKYWTMSWDGINGTSGTLNEAAPNPITGSQNTDGQIFLTRTSVESLTSPHILITDIQLDDKLELLFVLSVRLSLLPITPAAAVSASHPIQHSDNSGTVEFPAFSNDAVINSTVGTYGTHVFVVNVSTAEVLFRTCKNKIIQNVQTQLTKLHTYRNISDGQIQSQPSAFNQTGKNGQLLSAWVAHGSFDFDYSGLLSDFANASLPGVASYTYDEFDSTRTPYLDFTEIFGQEDSTLTVGPFATRATDLFNVSQFHGVRASFTRRRVWQRKRYFMSGTYLPRRATSPTRLPLGILLVKVKLEVRATATTLLPASSYGFFLHDLEGNTTTILVPMTSNFHSSQGVTHPVSHSTFSNIPETDGVFVVLGFNGTHLLWVHAHRDIFGGPDIVDIKLTNVNTGDTVVVISGAGDVDVAGDATYAAALQAFLLRNFQVPRPDFFYYPAETAPGNNFIRAWNAAGVPTLDAAEPGFPIIDSELANLGTLQQLPSAVVPIEDRIIAKNQGPVNIEDLSQIGPVWHVVQDSTVLGAKLTADP